MRWLSRYWPIMPLLLIALLARDWVEDAPTTVEVEDTIDMRATQSDYYLEDFTTEKFDPTGKLQYRVSGQKLLHYPEDDRSEITAPAVVLLRDGVRWGITSKHGKMLRTPDTFTLLGDVNIERSGQNDDVVNLRTDSLTVHTETNEVSTEDVIEVIADGWKLRSVGMQSDIDKGTLIFQSKVTGHYDVAIPDAE